MRWQCSRRTGAYDCRPEWYERYQRRAQRALPKDRSARGSAQTVGEDGGRFWRPWTPLSAAGTARVEIIQTVRTVWQQHYEGRPGTAPGRGLRAPAGPLEGAQGFPVRPRQLESP